MLTYELKKSPGVPLYEALYRCIRGDILSGIAKFYKPEDLIGKTLVAITNLPPRKMMGRES